VKNTIVKCGDVVRYPVGFTLAVRKVYADKKGVYVRECINEKDEYRRYIYVNMDGYKWDTRLCKELGFRLANQDELQYLED